MHRALGPIFGRYNRLAESAIKATMNRFRTTFNTVDKAKSYYLASWAFGVVSKMMRFYTVELL